MKNFLSLGCSVLVVAIVLTGCDKVPFLNKNWLVGTWMLDRNKTLEAFKTNNQRSVPAGGVVGELVASAVRGGVDAMIKPFENIHLVISETEIVEKTSAGHSNKPRTYKIVDRPAAGQIKILDSNNEVTVFHQEGDLIWHYYKNNEKLQVYLKPVTSEVK